VYSIILKIICGSNPLSPGRCFRAPTIMDVYSRECLNIYAIEKMPKELKEKAMVKRRSLK